MAVPDDILRDAGFDLPVPATASGRRRPVTPWTGGRRAGSGVAQVRAWVLEHAPEVFTVPDAIEASGASAAVARRAITQLVDDGKLTSLGPAPDWDRPGRAPVRYGRPAGRVAA
jgi:hypothetical protein